VPDLEIRSHRGLYAVRFGSAFAGLEKGLAPTEHLIIDAKVAELHAKALGPALAGASVLRVEATELNKSLERFPDHATHLLSRGLRRGHTLVAVGGGIIQDITAFLAATMLRGVPWVFHPTTLLAQADSCIGSKSSVNVGAWKNQLGTFTPPREIRVSLDALSTLDERDMRSGIGEMIKVHVIAGPEEVRALAADFPRLLADRAALERALRRSLEIKKRLIELDEFDEKERLVLNYGHSFGHAIESATDFAIPHGIAVTMGMELANALSVRRGLVARAELEAAATMIAANRAGFERVEVPEDRFLQALARDKKNAGTGEARLVLLRGPGKVFLERVALDDDFRSFCRGYFAGLRDAAGAGR
jgi:3-dehydroquinate synthase